MKAPIEISEIIDPNIIRIVFTAKYSGRNSTILMLFHPIILRIKPGLRLSEKNTFGASRLR